MINLKATAAHHCFAVLYSSITIQHLLFTFSLTQRKKGAAHSAFWTSRKPWKGSLLRKTTRSSIEFISPIDLKNSMLRVKS